MSRWGVCRGCAYLHLHLVFSDVQTGLYSTLDWSPKHWMNPLTRNDLGKQVFKISLTSEVLYWDAVGGWV